MTKAAAERLAREKHADLYEIEPAEKYSSADLDWSNMKSRSNAEMKDRTSRPALKAEDFDAAKYDEIYLGFPIWWGIAPHIINSFLEAYDFSGKKIYPFATSGGSGYGRSNEALEASAPKADWHPGKMF